MAGAILGLWILAASALAGPPAREFRDCAECPAMIEIPPGHFDMGASPTDPDRNAWEEPQHRVTIARPFAAGRFPITRREFAAFIAAVGEPADKLCTAWQGTKWGKDPTKSWRILEHLKLCWRGNGKRQRLPRERLGLSQTDAPAIRAVMPCRLNIDRGGMPFPVSWPGDDIHLASKLRRHP